MKVKEISGLRYWCAVLRRLGPTASRRGPCLTRIVHLIRYSLQFSSWKERKGLARALRAIYGAVSAEASAAELDRFDAGPYAERYAVVVVTWRRRCSEVIPFFAFSPEVRKILYATNAIESLHSQARKAIRNKAHFPSDEAAAKLIYLALRNITAKWKNSTQGMACCQGAVRNPVRRPICADRLDAGGRLNTQDFLQVRLLVCVATTKPTPTGAPIRHGGPGRFSPPPRTRPPRPMLRSLRSLRMGAPPLQCPHRVNPQEAREKFPHVSEPRQSALMYIDPQADNT